MISTISFRRSLGIALMIAGSVLPLASRAAVTSGSLIKSTSDSAVYYMEASKRYAFPNEKVFNSWYSDFSSVVTVSDTELASYTLTGNVTYRPGTTLVKITTDPKVYAVSRFGVLRWIMTEQVASQLYGADWAKKVQDIPDTFFTNYLMGSAVGAAADYDLLNESGVKAITDNIRSNGFVPPVVSTTPPSTTPPVAPPTVATTISTNQATLNQIIIVFASVTGSAKPITKIQIYQNHDNSPIATCLNATTCSAQFTVTQAPLNIRYRAVATDNSGATFESPLGLQAQLDVPAASSDLIISAAPFNLTAGDRANFSSDATKFPLLTSHRIYIAIPGEPSPVLWKDCGVSALCAGSTPFYRTSQIFSKVIVGGQTTMSASVNVTVTSGTPPKPVLSLLPNPTPHQVTLHVDAPSGETIGWTSIIEGTTTEDTTIGLCQYSTCDVTLLVTYAHTYTAFTDVGGKLEGSNNISVTP